MLSEWKWTLFEQSNPFLLCVFLWFFRFCSAPSKCCGAFTKCQWLLYRPRCVCMQWDCTLRTCVIMDASPSNTSASCVFYEWGGWMDRWMERKEKSEGIVDLMDWLLTFCIHLSLSHFQSQHLISSHMLSHWVRNQSFSLPLSLPIYLYRSLCHFILAIPYQSNTLAVGTNERVSLQSRSNHTTSSLGLFQWPALSCFIPFPL